MTYEKYNVEDPLPKSEYKGVYPNISRSGGYIQWKATKIHKGKIYSRWFQTEREAAVGYDKMCLSLGLKPVNILKIKSK